MPKTTPKKTDRITVRIEPSLRVALRQYYPDLQPSEALRIIAWKEIKRIKISMVNDRNAVPVEMRQESA